MEQSEIRGRNLKQAPRISLRSIRATILLPDFK